MTDEKQASSSADKEESGIKNQESSEQQEESKKAPEAPKEQEAPSDAKAMDDKPAENSAEPAKEAPTSPEEGGAEESTETEELKEEAKDYSYLKPGMTVKVHQKITEAGKKKGETKERIQIFEGMIIAIKNAGVSKTITVRKVSNGVGVEKIYPLALPTIVEIEPVKQAKVRHSKLYYLRDHKKKLKERHIKKDK